MLLLETGICSILTMDSTPCGYILGTDDSITFYEKCEEMWFPKFCKQYPLPKKHEGSLKANYKRHLNRGHIIENGLKDYSAHCSRESIWS